jgi:hypothetical protein
MLNAGLCDFVAAAGVGSDLGVVFVTFWGVDFQGCA